MNKLTYLIISWFGVSGLFKRARGTWGTLATLPFAYVIHIAFGSVGLVVAAVLVFALGTWASQHYVTQTGKQDPGEIVVDEAAATFLLLAFLFPTWQSYLVAFFIFRAFDVVKPWPVSLADKHIKGGFGVMFDDILAALYPVLLFLLFQQFFPDYSGIALNWLRGDHVG